MVPHELDDSGHENSDSGGETSTTGKDRRTVLRAAGAGAIGTALAGCMSGLGDQRYAAHPAMLKAADHGYVLDGARESKVSRQKTIKGQTVKITLISKLAGYEFRSSGGRSPFVGESSLGLVSTPAAEVQGVAVNPVAEKPLKELLAGDLGKEFMKQVDLGDASWQDGPQEVATRNEKLLGKSAEVKTFAGTTSEDEFALLNVARVTDGDDAVLVGDSRSKSFAQPKETFVGENGFITQAELDQSSELFVAVLPYVIHGEGVDFPTTTGTPKSTPAGETAPLFEVTSRGPSQEEVAALGEELGVENPDQYYDPDTGLVQYVDEEAYMHVPMETSASGTDDPEEGGRDATMKLQLDALEELPEPPNGDEMLGTFQSALEEAELHPADDWPGTIETSTSHASFGLADKETGKTELEKDLDTAVYLRPRLDGHAVEGPGAKIRARFADLGDGPVLSDLRYSFRDVRPAGTQVKLLSESAALDRYRKRFRNTVDAESVEPEIERLVYLAPELNRSTTGEDSVLVGSGTNEVSELVPHYVVGGTAEMGGEQVELMPEFIPATDDERVVAPPPRIESETEGDQVSVRAELSGGRRPYTVEASVADGSLTGLEQTGSDPPEFTGTFSTRSDVSETTLMLTVTDANGVTVRSSTTISVDADAVVGYAVAGAGPGGRDAVALDTDHGVAANPTSSGVPGTADIGYEGTDFLNWSDNYVAAARALGINVNNTWEGNDVWENDYEDPTDDQYGIDTADHTFTAAHGNPMGIGVPNTGNDDGFVHHTDSDKAWGDHDLEWHSLMCCNMLAPDDGQCGGCNGKSRIERWWQEFDGLHQIQGFQTKSYPSNGFLKGLATLIFGPSLVPAQKMRTAWFMAIDNYQPGPSKNQRWKKRGVVMGPMDANRNCTADDHFWGRGPIGPEIDHEDVRYIYWFVGATGGG